MANIQLNRLIKSRQMKKFGVIGGGFLILLLVIVGFLADAKPKKHAVVDKGTDLTGIIDESFTQADAESALTVQQSELESLKLQMHDLTESMKRLNETRVLAHDEQIAKLKEELQSIIKEKSTEGSQAAIAGNQAGLWHNPMTQAITPPRIHTVSFRHIKNRKISRTHLDPNHYVPSNTSVRAVILGGADADASVNGQSKNNGVMLFKFIEDGTLPNGQHSRLMGCRVSGNAYGDISSERAFATLYKISCAHPGEAIIDKEVTGWVFFKGKVGVKGVPLMRDNKIMQWAGISGALSGIASAAQYAQSVQSISSFGAASVVPQQNIGPYAAYGGASKAADVLSQYYVKRAEQYHPVIQVGSGNVVTIVFKDGFYLEAEEETSRQDRPREVRVMHPVSHSMNEANLQSETGDQPNFNVPPEVLGQIDHLSNQSFEPQGVQQ